MIDPGVVMPAVSEEEGMYWCLRELLQCSELNVLTLICIAWFTG